MSKTDQAALGNRIREEREYRGFSQDDLARHLDVPRSAISSIETGTLTVEAIKLQRIARLFGCPMAVLTGGAAVAGESASVSMLARAASTLTADDQLEVLQFAKFLRSQKPGRA